ncbi:30S ribosomal protein S10 [Pseudomonas tritici]|uniref:30S ribosomal protein S10 n=1 Tax=Pseudomonas tritici TaxID=2745518 RepID=UPI00387B2DD0
MLTDAKCAVPWDLADKKTQRIRFSAASFYIVVDGIQSDAVRSACKSLKTFVQKWEGVRCRGPKAMPTERRRWMKMREMKNNYAMKGVYLTQPVRYRSVLLVVDPSNEMMTGLIGVELPSDINIKIEPYDNQYDLREDR